MRRAYHEVYDKMANADSRRIAVRFCGATRQPGVVFHLQFCCAVLSGSVWLYVAQCHSVGVSVALGGCM